MTRILVIEDDPKLVDLLTSDFELEGWEVQSAQDGAQGLALVDRFKPHLIVLDVMLPKMSGYDVCRTLRQEKNDVPILMLTAKGQEAEKVVGFELGADDYLTKPFGGMELLARVKALLRRGQKSAPRPGVVVFGDIEVNFPAMAATKSGKRLHLTPKEFQILELLLAHRGHVVTRQKFLEEIWGYDEDAPNTRTLDNQVLSLRHKLANAKGVSPITTVHSVGYKFDA